MGAIKEFMTTDHRDCDQPFVDFETAVSEQNWTDAEKFFRLFLDKMNNHLGYEEEILFPAFEEASGIRQGPTSVMRYEHSQMRGMIEELSYSVKERNEDRVLGLCETLMMLIQQHNNKEEQMLYAMMDMHLNSKAEVLLAQFK